MTGNDKRVKIIMEFNRWFKPLLILQVSVVKWLSHLSNTQTVRSRAITFLALHVIFLPKGCVVFTLYIPLKPPRKSPREKVPGRKILLAPDLPRNILTMLSTS